LGDPKLHPSIWDLISSTEYITGKLIFLDKDFIQLKPVNVFITYVAMFGNTLSCEGPLNFHFLLSPSFFSSFFFSSFIAPMAARTAAESGSTPGKF